MSGQYYYSSPDISSKSAIEAARADLLPGWCKHLTHKLGLKVEAKSMAVWKWWKMKRGPIKTFIEQENYAIQFKFKNMGEQKFPGGDAETGITWPSAGDIGVHWPLKVPELKVDQEDYARFDDGSLIHTEEAIATGYGLISWGYISSLDGQKVEMVDFGGHPHYIHFSIGSIPAKSWAELYAKYSMIVSAFGLFIVALDRIVAFLMWLLRIHL